MYIERITTPSDWIIYILLICMVLLTILRARYPYRFQRFINLTYQTNFLKLYNRDIDHRHLFTFISTFFNILSTSLFIYLCAQFYLPEWQVEGLHWYIRISTIYAIFLLGKMWIEQIVGISIKSTKEISNYVYEKLLYRNLLSIFILIWNILLLISLEITQASLGLAWVSILAVNVFSLLSVHKRNRPKLFRHFFYFILYLCALEIGPYLLIIYTLIGF